MTDNLYKNMLEAYGSAYGTGQATTEKLKLADLENAKQSKLERLGSNNQEASLENSNTIMPAGNIESNSNKIWNNMDAVGIQDLLSDAANQQITKGDDGKFYKGNGEEYTGDFKDLRRAYMYGTKDSDTAVKFGLARGDLPSSDYRYEPGRAEKEGFNVGKNGYGWDAGDNGVDTSKNYMDMLLSYNVATALEAAIHGRKGAIANREYPDYLSPEALGHASGVSEYYNSAEGLFGDTSGATKEELEAGDTDLLAKYSRLRGAQARGEEDFADAGSLSYEDYKEFKDKKDDSSFIDAGQAYLSRLGAGVELALAQPMKLWDKEGSEKLAKGANYTLENADMLSGYNTEDMSTVQKMTRAGAAGAVDVGNRVVALAGEGIETVGEGILGLKSLDKKFIENENKRLAKYGESVSDTRVSALDTLKVSEFGDWVKNVGTSIQKDTTEFAKENKSSKIVGFDTSDTSNLMAEIDNTIKTEGFMAALGKGITDVRSLQVLAQSVPEMVALAVSVGGMAVANTNHNINVAEDNAGRDLTSAEKAKSAAVSIVSTYLDRFGDKVALGGMNVPKAALKKAVDAAPESVKSMLASKYGKGILAIGEKPFRVAKAMVVEGTTEKLQTLGETAAQNVEVFTDGYTEKQVDESDVAGVMGAAMGGHMNVAVKAPKDAAGIIGAVSTGLDAGREYLDNKLENEVNVTSDAKRATTAAGRQNRYESVNIDDESYEVKDPFVRDSLTKDIVQHVADKWFAPGIEVGVDPVKMLDEASKKIAKVNGLSSKESEGIVNTELVKQIYSLGNQKDPKTGTTMFSKENIAEMLGKVGDVIKGDTKAERTLERLYEQELSDTFVDIRTRLGVEPDADISNNGILTEDELTRLQATIKDMRTLGSEEITDKANKIENAILKRQSILGSEETTGKDPEKTIKEVSKEVEEAGFLFNGRYKKSLKEHARDLEEYVVKDQDSVLGKEDRDDTIKQIEEFVKSRDGKTFVMTKDKKLRSMFAIRKFLAETLSENARMHEMLSKVYEGVSNPEIKAKLDVMLTSIASTVEDSNKKLELINKNDTEVDKALYRELGSTGKGKVSEAWLSKQLATYERVDKPYRPSDDVEYDETETDFEEVSKPKKKLSLADIEKFIVDNGDEYSKIVSRISDGTATEGDRKSAATFEKVLAARERGLEAKKKPKVTETKLMPEIDEGTNEYAESKEELGAPVKESTKEPVKDEKDILREIVAGVSSDLEKLQGSVGPSLSKALGKIIDDLDFKGCE